MDGGPVPDRFAGHLAGGRLHLGVPVRLWLFNDPFGALKSASHRAKSRPVAVKVEGRRVHPKPPHRTSKYPNPLMLLSPLSGAQVAVLPTVLFPS